jgi:hypothetical protein
LRAFSRYPITTIPPHGLAFAIPFRYTFPHVRAEGNRAQIPEVCGRILELSGTRYMIYKLFWLKQNHPENYAMTFAFGNRYTRCWDEPKTNVG